MGKLSKYLIKDFLATFGVAMLLITFAFSIGAIYKAIDFMAKGLPIALVGKFAFYNLPYSLAYTIPISSLFATLLLFGRLSSDSEISAMKSGGLSMWQISSPVLLISMGLVCISFYNSFVIYPNTTYANRKLLNSMGVDDPIKLLEEGRFVRDFPGYMIYIGKKNRNRVRDLIVYEVDKKTGAVTQTIRADSGVMTVDKEASLLKIDLFDVRIEVLDEDAPEDSSKTRYMSAKEFPVRVDFDELIHNKTLYKKRKNMTFTELTARIRDPNSDLKWMRKYDLVIEHGRDLVEINQRICLAIAPFMFVLVAIPLGIKSHRKESSVGMVLSLAIMFVYYLFIILSDTFDKSPHLYPWLMPWVPIIGGQIWGFVLIRKAN